VFPFSKVKKEISTNFHSTHNPIVFYASLKFPLRCIFCFSFSFMLKHDV
jgi:hypothetical protein